MEIETYFVSFAAFISCLALWSVRSMPWRLRISLIIPHAYFVILYLVPMDLQSRSLLVRGGLIAMFVTNGIVAAIQHYSDKRRQTWITRHL